MMTAMASHMQRRLPRRSAKKKLTMHPRKHPGIYHQYSVETKSGDEIFHTNVVDGDNDTGKSGRRVVEGLHKVRVGNDAAKNTLVISKKNISLIPEISANVLGLPIALSS